MFATMACETFNQDLEMINAGCCSLDSPLTTHFLLPAFEGNHLCPRFYGKIEDKKKVCHALKEDMHAEVQTKWGELKCHCSRIPIIRLSKTARDVNKVFLTCGTPATADTRCKYFQWIHTPLFIDKRPIHNLKYATNLTRTEWMQQAETNVEKWKQQNGWYKVKKQNVQTQTEWAEEKQKQAWLNQFAESAKKQKEQRKSQTSYPWKSTPPPSAFHLMPQIAKELKKREHWKEVQNIANHEFYARIKRRKQVPEEDRSLASYLQKQKLKGVMLSLADEKYLEACQPNKHDEWKPPPGAEKYEKNEAAIAKAAYVDWPFCYLPEKVCRLASYCRNRKQKGLPLTPVQERFFAQLVNVYHEPELPKCHEQFFEGLKQGASIKCQFLNKSVEKEFFCGCFLVRVKP